MRKENERNGSLRPATTTGGGGAEPQFAYNPLNGLPLSTPMLRLPRRIPFAVGDVSYNTAANEAG